MAQRRMFSKKITETDNFLDMPLSSQALYFHLNMGADDEGFIDKVKTIQRTIGASDDDVKILIAKGFIIPFESGVVVIRHWRIHNYIQADRFQSTIHKEEKEQLEFDKSKIANIKPLDQCIQNVYKVDTQVRIGKDRLDKDRLDKDRLDKDRLDKDRLELDKVNNLNYTGGENEKKSFSQIIKESNIKLNDRQAQMLLDYVGLDNMTIEMIQYAVELTEDAGANNFNYLNKILKSWREKKLTSLEAVKKDVEEFEIRKSNPSADNPAVFKPYRDELPF